MNDTIQERIQSDITVAMKERDADTLSTLRMLKTALMEARIQKKSRDTVLAPEEEMEVLQRYAKKRRETIAELRKAGREDLVAREEQEIAITNRYLPAAPGEDELRAIVREAITATGASGPRDMGKVIGAVMARLKGRADGSEVSRVVRELLAG